MAEQAINLNYIIDPFEQFMNLNGKPLVGGYITLYLAGTDEKYISYQNFDYTQNPFKVPINSDGRVTILVDVSQSYDAYVYSSNGNLVVSRLNLSCPGGVAGGGLREVIHDETMTGRGTQLSPLGVSPLTNLAVDDTMTAYEATVEGKDSLVLGVNGDWFNNQFGSAFSGKVDWSAFNSAYYGLKGDISGKADWSALNNYYTKNETWNTFLPRSGIDLSNYYTKDEVYNKSEVETQLIYKQNRLTFEYNDASAISSINGSALAGQGGEGGNCPWISGTKVIADTQTLTSNMILQVLSSFTMSGDHNHFIGMKGGTYRFPNEYEIGSALLHTNYFMHLSAMSGYLPQSAFSSYTASIANNLENNWNYTNSAYSLSLSNFYNKLDVSAFSSYSAGQDTIINNITDQITNISNASGGWNDKLDSSAFENASGNFYPMTGNPSGFLTEHQSLEDYYKKTETSSKEEISAAIANVPQGDPEVNNVVHNYSANGTWLTAHQDISNLATKDEVSGYILKSESGVFQPSGNYLSSNALNGYATQQWVENQGYLTAHQDISNLATKDEVSSYLLKSESGNFYPMTGNPSGFLTGVDLSNYYQKNETSSKQEISAALNYVSGQINNKLDTTAFTAWSSTIFDEDYELSAGDGIELVDDDVNKITRIDFTGTSGPDLSAGEGIEITTNGGKTIITNNISAGTNMSLVYDQESNKIRIDCESEGKIYSGVAPIQVNNSTNQISISGESLSAGPGIDIFSSGGYVVISSYGGNTPTTYCYVYPSGYGELDLDTMTAYNKVTVFAPGDYSPDRMLYGTNDDLTHAQKVMPSGLWVEAIKNRKQGGQFSWSLINSGWIGYNHMWEGD